ncbi:hypothetical protein E4T56_gene1065 [Termitomyces sp. T112]|nr:hypothetical protein E4T56_gene1065 [Termitomyces sp. T112]
MAAKKSKAKQKTADKDVKKEPTPPTRAPADSELDSEPIPVPEPLPLPVPPPVAKQSPPDDTKDLLSQDDVEHPYEKEVVEGDEWGPGGGDGWGDAGVGGSGGWGNDNLEWGDEGADYEFEGRNDGEEERDRGNSGWGQTGTNPAPSIDQERPSLGQPIQDHVPTRAASTPVPLPPPPAALIQPSQSHDQSESSGTQHTKMAPPQSQDQDSSHSKLKTYTFASTMANPNRSASQPASSAPPSSRPSYYWAPNQSKQPMSTTKGHNPVLTNLTPWGQPKNVDPWGDPKPQSAPPAPPAPPPALPAATQKRPAWYDWGRPPQTAVRAPPTNHRTDYGHDYDSDDDGYTDDGYTDHDDESYDARGRPTHASHGWGPDPRKHNKVNNAPLGFDNGMSTGFKPVLSQAEHAYTLNAMLNDVHQGYTGYHQHPQAPHHDPEPSHHQLEKARRLKQIAEEQRRLAMETEMFHQQKAHKQHRDQGRGKSSQKQKHKGDERNDNGWGTPKDERWTSSGWDRSGGQGQDDNGWGQSGNGWDQGGNDWGENSGDNSWGNNSGNDWGNNGAGNGRDGGGDAWGKAGGDAKDNSGGDGWNNGGGDGWNNVGGDGWDDGGKDGWNNGGGDGWDNTGGDDWGKGGGNKKVKNQGDTWDGHDNSWDATKASNGWGGNDGWDQNDGWGHGNNEQTWNDAEEDWKEASRYHVVTDISQHKSSKTFLYAIAKDPQTTKLSTSSKLGLPPGTVNESENQAFQPALKAIFGREWRMAKDRIHWTYSPENEPKVASVLFWIQQMESFLALLGLLKFLETKERGALFVNVTFRLKEYPDKPAFDWLRYDQVQASTDRILQHSILATDPAQQTIVFVYLLSRTGNSVAMWRRKLQVPKDVRQKHLQAIKKVKAGLRPDKDYRIHVDELPPSDKGKQTKPAKLSRSKATAKVKQATQAEPAKSMKDQDPTKKAKSVLKTHQHGRSISTIPEKKRKWWQILRFAD